MNRLSNTICTRHPKVHSCLILKRWFDWDPRVTRKDGKPAITGTKSVYVSALIPVVLTKDIPGLGSKGEILNVKRGFARNVLVPEGSAVYGTLWENIDAFADPLKLKAKKFEDESKLNIKIAPFDWINSVRLEFLRETEPVTGKNSTGKLTESVTVGDILNALSSLEQTDLLPSQITFPKDGITSVGLHTIPVQLALGNGTYSYLLKVDVKDRAEVIAAEKREAELREAMKLKRPDFVLGSSRFSTDTSEDYTDYDESDSEDAHSSDDEN